MSVKLLLADDSITIQKVVELILADEGYEIRSIGAGDEALALLHSFAPDIVLADVDMPGINGYDLCDRIKKGSDTRHIAVILLIGAFDPFDEERIRQVGADDYLIKPFGSHELLEKMNAVLSARSAPEPSETPPEEAPQPQAFPGEIDLLNEKEKPVPIAASALGEGEDMGASTEELIGVGEEAEELAERGEAEKEGIEKKAGSLEETASLSTLFSLTKSDIQDTLEKVLRETVSSRLSSTDLKEAIVASMTPFMKESLDKILWDLTPELVERTLKEILKGSIESLTTEVQKVIWETVPEIAERMISQEIERIRSEF